MSDSMFRIHPAIGFARVGTSEEYYLAPETLTGHPGAPGQPTGGVPIKAGSEAEPINGSDLRDKNCAMKRQAARFRIFAYPAPTAPETYPMGQSGTEIQIGSKIEVAGASRTVTDIVWTVHVANKKTAWYAAPDEDGIIAWDRPETDPVYPKLRNLPQGSNPDDPARLKRLVSDPGPRTITTTERAKSTPGQSSVGLDAKTPASYWKSGEGVMPLPDYPKTFPGDGFSTLNPPGVMPIQTLGDLETEANGRLIVIAAYGRANSFSTDAPEYGFVNAVNNDWWFDDTCDGPVNAVLVLDEGKRTLEVQGGAWVITTDPAYAPQIPNVVSLWDDIYDSWVRKLRLRPELFANGKFLDDYKPSFEDEIRPMFLAAGLQRWITNLSKLGILAHDTVAEIDAKRNPNTTDLHGLGLIREPVDPDKLSPFDPDHPNAMQPDKVAAGETGRGDPGASGDERRMPLSLGDSGRSLLSLTFTQHQYLKRWDRSADSDHARLQRNAGELLDEAALRAGLGGRFSPGIDMTYISREPNLYVQDWETSGTGPFRINPTTLNYETEREAPFLSLGWIPRRTGHDSLEPGDVSKFMAIPWHADYNSCGTHEPAPNSPMSNTLYWSWPAQRPVAVYVADDVKELGGKKLPDQRYSMRGPGTKTAGPQPAVEGYPANIAEVGRYQATPLGSKEPGIIRILDNWMKIGTVIQATNIDEPRADYDPGFYLEVQSQLSNDPAVSDKVIPWPNKVTPGESSS